MGNEMNLKMKAALSLLELSLAESGPFGKRFFRIDGLERAGPSIFH
jgi:hypothetical protein